MKREVENEMEDELLSEYDFAQMEGGVKGKYVERYRAGRNLVLLDPDVAQAFPNDAAVNGALRMLIEVAPASANQYCRAADGIEIVSEVIWCWCCDRT